MNRFVDGRWEFGAHVDAAARAKNNGDADGGGVLVDGITVCRLAESGAALRATVKSTKYWKDGELN